MSDAALAVSTTIGTDARPARQGWDRSGSAELGAPPFVVRRRKTLLANTVADRIVPRLVLALRTEPVPCSAAGEDAETDIRTLVSLVLKPEFDVDCAELVAIRARLADSDALCLHLLAPAGRRLGEMWEDDTADFMQVTVGLLRLQQVMTGLTRPLDPNPATGDHQRSVLLAPGPGNQHSFGLTMVAAFFQRAGWTGWAGAPVSTGELLARVRGDWYSVVGFSHGTDSHLEELAAMIRAVRKASRNRDVGIMVGGPIFMAHPELASSVGADATAVDGRQAVLQAQRLFAMQPSRG